MANEQGRYIGETIVATIFEDVGLGQVLYCASLPAGYPATSSLIVKGVWKVASADLGVGYYNPNNAQRGKEVWEYNPSSSYQLGISLTAASASTISLTQSGTEIPILLKGYYSPGLVGFGGYFDGGGNPGSPLYLAPSLDGYGTQNRAGSLTPDAPVPWTDDTAGFPLGSTTSNPLATLTYQTSCATQSVMRVVGYVYDLDFPYVIRFEPEKSWYELQQATTQSTPSIRLNGRVTINGVTLST